MIVNQQPQTQLSTSGCSCKNRGGNKEHPQWWHESIAGLERRLRIVAAWDAIARRPSNTLLFGVGDGKLGRDDPNIERNVQREPFDKDGR